MAESDGKPNISPARARSLANLRPPLKPGERLPGAGRPPTRHITERYRKLAEKQIPESLRKAFFASMKVNLPKATTYGDALALRQYYRAIAKGDTLAAKEITDRLEGKAVARIEHTGQDGGPIETTTEELDAKLARLLNIPLA